MLSLNTKRVTIFTKTTLNVCVKRFIAKKKISFEMKAEEKQKQNREMKIVSLMQFKEFLFSIQRNTKHLRTITKYKKRRKKKSWNFSHIFFRCLLSRFHRQCRDYI